MKTGCKPDEKPDENEKSLKSGKNFGSSKISRNFATLFGQNEKQPRTLKDLQ